MAASRRPPVGMAPISRKDDYFSYLGFSRQFSLDETDLKTSFEGFSPWSIPTNMLKQLLEHRIQDFEQSFSRANYLLGVLTNDSSEKSATGDFALRVMELNEEIERTDDKDALQKKLAEMESELSGLFSQLDRLFASNNLEEVRRLVSFIYLYTGGIWQKEDHSSTVALCPADYF
uniref:Co-chaperone HscB C-terminal oligomerisation domain-containing protein n=1 Tax=Ditylenchus dipsaci TaxID=166011 RepID=A0A915ESZ5_9BILA